MVLSDTFGPVGPAAYGGIWPARYSPGGAGVFRNATVFSSRFSDPDRRPIEDPSTAMLPLSVYATQALHGLVYGMLLFLASSGLTLVFGMMGTLSIRRSAEEGDGCASSPPSSRAGGNRA
jgi:hypothetical protein